MSRKNKHVYLLQANIWFIIILLLFVNAPKSFSKFLNLSFRTNNPNMVSDSKVPYTFKVSEKIQGEGAVSLHISGKEIIAHAIGEGKSGKYDVKMETDLNGLLSNSSGEISLNMRGAVDPSASLIPGKVTFDGPLKGTLSEGKLKLIGEVDIHGYLASISGFNEKEIVEIEISDNSIVSKLKENNNN